MPTSIFLAKLIGPLFLAVGVGLLLNAAHYRAMAEEALKSRALIYITGVITMAAGLSVVLSHNVWAADWRVIITLLGWLGTIGGALRIVWPQQTETMGHWVLARPAGMTVGAVFWLIVGAILSFYGYVR